MKYALACSLLIFFVVCTNAATIYPKTFEVEPGFNGEHILKEDLLPGDVLKVTFTAKKCYALKSCDVDDAQKLGWQKNGCTFTLVIKESFDKENMLKSRFYGKMVKTCGEGGTGGEEVLLDWDLIGKFSVYGDCEGADHDNGRTPPAAMETGGKTGDHDRAGEAEYKEDANKKWFKGTFGGKYTGQYSYLLTVDAPARNPKQLKVEDKPCPTDSKVEVKYVYFGCKDDGGIAAKLEKDLITINNYVPAAAMEALKKALDDAKAALEAAKAAEEQAKQESENADEEAAEKQAAYEEALSENEAVKKAQDRVAKAQERLNKANKDLADAKSRVESLKKQLADFVDLKDEFIKDFGVETYELNVANREKSIADAEEDVIDEQGDVEFAERSLERAEEALQRAIENNLDELGPLKEAAEAASAVAEAAKAAYENAKKATADAQKKVDEAQKALDEAMANDENAERLAFWQQWYDGTMVHELGHRRIAYFYADKITDWMNTFQAWGWSPEEKRAAQLGKEHFKVVLNAYIVKTLKEHEDFQVHYDSPQGSDHGEKQDEWDWGQLQ